MASICATLGAVAPAAVAAKAARSQAAPAVAPIAGLTAVSKAATVAVPAVSNGSVDRSMLVWQPTNNKFFETLSFLPPLDDAQIAKQVDYITSNGWVPCLEFADGADKAYVCSEATVRFGAVSANYFDNRYWTMYKLPMFGCSDSGQVLTEIANAVKTFPNAYVRLVAFDNVRQVQCAGFLVHRPTQDDICAPEKRSV